MPRKNSSTSEESKDHQKSIAFIMEEIVYLKLHQESIPYLLEEVKTLRIQNAEKERRLRYFESRVSEMEKHSRMNDVIVSGLPINPWSNVQAVSDDSEGEDGEQEIRSAEKHVAAFLRSRGIEMDINSIETCHPQTHRNDRDTWSVVMKFVNRKDKVSLMKQASKLKGSNIFINEHLTKQNADIARKARQMKKEGKIQHTWTSKCEVLVKLNGTPEKAKIVVVKNMEELDKYQ